MVPISYAVLLCPCSCCPRSVCLRAPVYACDDKMKRCRLASPPFRALKVGLATSSARSKMMWFRLMPGERAFPDTHLPFTVYSVNVYMCVVYTEGCPTLLALGFATRHEGDRVRMGDNVILESVKMPDMYLHTNTNTSTGTTEVVLSSSPTKWQVLPWSKVQEQCDSQVVRGADYLRLYSPHCKAFGLRDSSSNARLLRQHQSTKRTSRAGAQAIPILTAPP
jgi:hypothetical protein